MCCTPLRIPRRSSASSFTLKFKENYLHRGAVFYFPSFHPSGHWGSHLLFCAREDSQCSAAAKQTAYCWRENKLAIMESCDHFCDILMEWIFFSWKFCNFFKIAVLLNICRFCQKWPKITWKVFHYHVRNYLCFCFHEWQKRHLWALSPILLLQSD